MYKWVRQNFSYRKCNVFGVSRKLMVFDLRVVLWCKEDCRADRSTNKTR